MSLIGPNPQIIVCVSLPCLQDCKKYLMAGGLFYECWTEMWTWITRFGKGFATWLTLHSVLSTRVFCSFNFLEAVKSANVPIFFLLSDRYIQLFFVCVTSNSYPGMPAGAHTMTTKKNSPTLRQTLSVWCSMAPIICHGNCQKGFQKKLASGQRRFSVQKNKPQRQNVPSCLVNFCFFCRLG